MVRTALLTLALAWFVPLADAQSTEADLQSRLLDKPLYLRGEWSEDQLKFDSAGHLLGTSETGSFTVSGIDVHLVKLAGNRLLIEGTRIGLKFDKGISRVELKSSSKFFAKPEHLHIEVQAPPDGNYRSALDSIFTSDLADFVPGLPDYWQKYGQEHLVLKPVSKDVPDHDSTTDTPIPIGGVVSPPILLFGPEPKFSSQARSVKTGGVVLVYFQVDREGKPDNIRILKPVGLGLEEMAVLAVSGYKFKPAQQNGAPVRVEVNVEVHFQVF